MLFSKFIVTRRYTSEELKTPIQTQWGTKTIAEWLQAEKIRIGKEAKVRTVQGRTYLEVADVEQETR